VGATDQIAHTPAGRFPCYRLDVVETNSASAPYGSFWFARGIGLVQFTARVNGAWQVFRLEKATIRGIDGVPYDIGQP
jgi:hypothetical protein